MNKVENKYREFDMERLEKLRFSWGSYGKNRGYSPFIKIIPITWCSTEHLKNILKGQQIGKEYHDYMERIVELREAMTADDLTKLEKENKKRREALPLVCYDSGVKAKEAEDLLLLEETDYEHLPLLVNHSWASNFTEGLYKKRLGKE